MYEHLAKQGMKLPYNAPNPLIIGYCPEIDVTSELGEDNASYYQNIIGVLQWIVELGCVDIDCEVV